MVRPRSRGGLPALQPCKREQALHVPAVPTRPLPRPIGAPSGCQRVPEIQRGRSRPHRTRNSIPALEGRDAFGHGVLTHAGTVGSAARPSRQTYANGNSRVACRMGTVSCSRRGLGRAWRRGRLAKPGGPAGIVVDWLRIGVAFLPRRALERHSTRLFSEGGAPLWRTLPACGSQQPASATFCCDCGVALGERRARAPITSATAESADHQPPGI
jgi:hypothetical protein